MGTNSKIFRNYKIQKAKAYRKKYVCRIPFENLKNFAKQKDLDVVKIIAEIGSGLNLKRKGLTEIMEVAKSKQVDMILTRDVSRISRDTFYSLKFIENIRKYVEFKTLDAFDISPDDWNSMPSVLSEFFDTYKKEIAC